MDSFLMSHTSVPAVKRAYGIPMKLRRVYTTGENEMWDEKMMSGRKKSVEKKARDTNMIFRGSVLPLRRTTFKSTPPSRSARITSLSYRSLPPTKLKLVTRKRMRISGQMLTVKCQLFIKPFCSLSIVPPRESLLHSFLCLFSHLPANIRVFVEICQFFFQGFNASDRNYKALAPVANDVFPSGICGADNGQSA